MRMGSTAVATALIMAPVGAWGADLVVWWEKGQYAQEDEAVREIIAAFEQKTGKQVEHVLDEQEEFLANLLAALETGRPTPDFVYTVVDIPQLELWAYEGRLVDLSEVTATFYLSNEDVGVVKPGAKAEVVADAWPDEVFEGTVRTRQ